MHTAAMTHIVVDDAGVPRIDGSRMKVIHIAAEKRYRGISPEVMHKDYWPDLSLAEIYAALAYYYDHQAEMDAEMDRMDADVERMRAENPNPFTREQLEQRLRDRSK